MVLIPQLSLLFIHNRHISHKNVSEITRAGVEKSTL